MHVDEFLTWDPPNGSDKWSLIDGMPVPWAPRTYQAARIVADAGWAIMECIKDRRPLCGMIRASFSPDERNVLAPALTVSAERPDRDAILLREPLLVVEVVDRCNAEVVQHSVPLYRMMPSIQEILMLQSSEILAELWRRSATGEWTSTTLTGADDLELTSIGLLAPLASFYDP